MRELYDLESSMSGDIQFENGDLKDTTGDPSRCPFQLLIAILNTKIGDNKYHPHLGFNADIYEGSLNTPQTGRNIARSIKTAILESSVFYNYEVEVTPYPISATQISFKITLMGIKGVLTTYNIVYDTSTNNILSKV